MTLREEIINKALLYREKCEFLGRYYHNRRAFDGKCGDMCYWFRKENYRDDFLMIGGLYLPKSSRYLSMMKAYLMKSLLDGGLYLGVNHYWLYHLKTDINIDLTYDQFYPKNELDHRIKIFEHEVDEYLPLYRDSTYDNFANVEIISNTMPMKSPFRQALVCTYRKPRFVATVQRNHARDVYHIEYLKDSGFDQYYYFKKNVRTSRYSVKYVNKLHIFGKPKSNSSHMEE